MNLIQLAQKNKIGFIGNSCDSETILNFQHWLLQQGHNNVILATKEINSSVNIPLFYRTTINIQNIKYIKNLLLIGVFPRYEASTFNLQLRKIANNFGNIIYNIGCFNNHNFSVKNSGTSFKTFFNFFVNKNNLTKVLLKKKDLLIVSKNSFDYINIKMNNNFYNQILMKKFFSHINDENLYNLISSNMSSNIFAEIGLTEMPKNLFSLNFYPNQKLKFHEVWGINFDGKNLKYKGSDITLFNTHNVTDNNLTFDNDLYLLPISSHFEKNNSYINVEGKIQLGYKAVSSVSNQIKNFSDIWESFSNYKDEYLNLIFTKKFFLEEIITDYYIDYTTFEEFLLIDWQKRLNKNYNKKNLNSLKEQFLKNQTLLNFVKFNKNKHLFSFYYLYFIPRDFKIDTNIFSFKNSIQNFYFTDMLTKNSNLMSLATFFNLTNSKLPIKR